MFSDPEQESIYFSSSPMKELYNSSEVFEGVGSETSQTVESGETGLNTFNIMDQIDPLIHADTVYVPTPPPNATAQQQSSDPVPVEPQNVTTKATTATPAAPQKTENGTDVLLGDVK
jgi:hypothetical protein